MAESSALRLPQAAGRAEKTISRGDRRDRRERLRTAVPPAGLSAGPGGHAIHRNEQRELRVLLVSVDRVSSCRAKRGGRNVIAAAFLLVSPQSRRPLREIRP
jgi:hypothetical protein